MNYKFSDKFLIKVVKDNTNLNGWKYRLTNIYEENDKDDENKFRYLMEKASPLYEHTLLRICEGFFNDHK